MSIKLIGTYEKGDYNRQATFNAFYVNPNRTFELVQVGGEMDLNKTWATGGNLTWVQPGRNKVDAEINIKSPPPSREIHTARGKLYTFDDFKTIEYLAKYISHVSADNYGSFGGISFGDTKHITGDVTVEWGQKRVRNYLNFEEKNNISNLVYKLHTPKFDNETLATFLTYKKSLPYHNITCEVFYPSNRSVVKADIDFKSFANMNGTINVNTPFKSLNRTGAHFVTETNSRVINRYIQLFWTNKTAIIDSKCNIITSPRSVLERETQGVVIIEVPLATRHVARVDYGYTEKDELSSGHATVEYNKTKVLEGKCNCLSESRAGFDKKTIHVELENKLAPIGADYVHVYEYNAPGDSSNIPTVDSKRLNVYNLHNKTALNVTGQVKVRTTFTGQEIALTATDSNRTVKFWTTYDVLDQQFKQHSRLELEPTAWIAYDIDLLNKTQDDTSEAQQIQINLSYPRRNFTVHGSYNITDTSLSSDVGMEWNNEEVKSVQAGFNWTRDRPSHHEIRLQVKHPSFEKDVSFLGEYEATARKLANVRLTADYSNDPEQLVELMGIVENHSKNYIMNYTYGLWGKHPATNLQLDTRGGVFWRSKFFNSSHTTEYSRTFLPQSMEALAMIDLEQNEVKLKRKTPTELSYFWGRYAGKFPLYTTNVSAIYGNDINASGEFYLNFREKLVQLELNKTTDGSQSLHMYGVIPDARSAVFDIWRDYEDIRVSDVAYFLRLNHSRLVVSLLKWRPDLKQEILDGIRSTLYNTYRDFTEETETARQYIRSEVTDAISGIWRNAKPQVRDFLDDVRDLKVIEEDLHELKLFLNNSYYANDFYIRDAVDFVLFTLDESTRSHLEALPAIVNEIWEAMGESGKKINASIMWAIDKIKSYYTNATDFLSGLLQGDSLEHLTETLKAFLEKYDNFIKDMHVTFIRYMEDLWNKTYRMLLNNWHKTLANIEPTFIKLIHYLESIAWNAGQEFFDFLYIRRTELMGSEYFNKFANFSHDVDRFYRDITGNDTIGSVYKYTVITWNFVKQKYFELVPFSKELQQVVNEIVGEITQLKNLPSIRFLLEKYEELYEKVKWFSDYFDVPNRIHRFITLIRLKLTDMKQNALQAENRYREAKTKFIFESADGIMYLEQKLPMSWHAFNETPKFKEIPEYKAVRDMQKYFTMSRITFTSLYQDFKPFTDVTELLPPFKAQAMLARGRHFVTFDGVVYNFKGDCTYLLASDFVDGNFSVAVSYDDRNPRAYNLLILIEKTLIDIDFRDMRVTVGNNRNIPLPIQIGHTYLYQEADIVTLESELGFKMECKMKFEVCTLEVSGWYFGKTAGLWGTMNNEPSDDLLTPKRSRPEDVSSFVESWSLKKKCEKSVEQYSGKTPEDIRSLCESLYDSKVSPFSVCFSRVPTKSILDMCLSASTEEEACTSAIVYMKMCSFENTPLRIPEACVKCNMLNGSVVPEGEFVRLEGESVPSSADIVFIVEAKNCNADVRNKRKIDMIVENLEKELSELNIRQNRYSVVAFGNGNGVFDQPRSVVINSNVFTEHQLIPPFFDHIQTGEKGNSDIFGALTFATKLQFRAGVSKTFILLPCTDCHESRMELDYSILHQLLLENDIALHILMNEDFRLKKTRGNKIFFGIDRYFAYTKKDADNFSGDEKLRKELKLPKPSLGFCMPLALESNGSVFSGKKLEMKIARKVASVFAKRIAKSAVPGRCKSCECTSYNTGVSYMECFPCTYGMPLTADFEINEDDLLAVMQPGDNLEDYYDDYY